MAGPQPHVPLLLGPDEATVPSGGRLAAVLGLLVFLDPAPPLGQLETPVRRHRHRRGWRRPVIGARRRGSRVPARRRCRLARETGDCRSGAFGMEGDLRMVKLRRQIISAGGLVLRASIWEEDYERSRAWRSSRILNLSRYFFFSLFF